MHFGLTDDQLSLRSAVRDLIADHAGPDAVRAVYDAADLVDPVDGTDGTPPGFWAQLSAQGWPAVLVGEDDGGLGLDLLDAAVIARALGEGAVPGPVIGSMLAGRALSRYGSPEQRERWLPPLTDGTATIALALLDPGAALEAPGDGVTAAGDRLTGSVAAVEYAGSADAVLVAARSTDRDDGVGLWLVEPGGQAATGLTITASPALDRTTRLAGLRLDGATADPLKGTGRPEVSDLVDAATALVANDLAGTARTALDRTVEYLKTREQFGRKVGSFQALQHHLADLLVAVTMAEHAGLHAAYALDAGLNPALNPALNPGLAVSVAKAKASDVAVAATSTMIQYHGGIGFTWEHDAHFYFKRARRLAQTYGDAAAHRERIAGLLI